MEQFYDLGVRSIHRSDLTPIDLKDFYVITCISNTRRFKSRYNLYRKFAKHMQESGVKLFTVEVAYGDRPFEITEDTYGTEIRLRTRHELWTKECMLNIAISRLPSDWKYVAFLDSDIKFSRPDWAHECVQLLQHSDWLQLFTTALDIGPHPNYDVIGTNYGFMYCYHNYMTNKQIPNLIVDGHLNPDRHSAKIPYYGISKNNAVWHHPGYSWAARREAIEGVGGLYDMGVLGSSDHIMCLAMVGLAQYGLPKGISEGYRKSIMAWQDRCLRTSRKKVGYMPGVISHDYHGPKVNRRYWDRNKIIVENQFDPYTDLIRDSQGLYALVDHGDDRSIRLRDQISYYFNQRNEDATS